MESLSSTCGGSWMAPRLPPELIFNTETAGARKLERRRRAAGFACGRASADSLRICQHSDIKDRESGFQKRSERSSREALRGRRGR